MGSNGLINRTTDFALKVAVAVTIVPTSCSVQLSGWKVYGMCTVKRVVGRKNRMCKWNMKNKNNTEEFQGFVGYTYMYSENYVKETCAFLREIPVDNGNYTYSISESSHPADQWGKTIYIEKPDVPHHNCSKMILEGSSMTCTCFTPKLGNPPALVGWEGLGETYLTIQGNKQNQGIVFTCSLTWGVISYTTPYVINIAYGPSQTYISSSEESSGDETKTMLMCTAIDVYPSAVFHWNIACDKETHGVNTSTCTLSTSRVEDNTAVECMATNQVFVEVSSASIYVFKPRRTHIKNNHLMVGIIAGSGGAMIILTILVAVIVVCVKRRIANKTPTHNVHFTAPSTDVNTISHRRENEYITFDDPTLLRIPETRTPVVRTSAPSGDLYTIVGPATVGDNEEVAVQEAVKNRTRATIRISGLQAGTTDAQTNETTESTSLAIMHKPTRIDKKELHNQSVTDYMNIPQVPWNSRLGVYHHVRQAAASETRISDANATDGTDEYDVLRVQKSRTGQEDHAATYSRLDFK
ncbi:uncharacterized protein LOC112569198 isoform X2 [Pomacea canaliculata]|uniref:uncharacterized protein LOC112569198 isoform X2 n=1 Tax=Pomacea canaliculata TaxID=400727 RepID=UPI000D73191D|nr:uncharacterized protein LOC112569198 isoform X2 [Pomacea canaliculata]